MDLASFPVFHHSYRRLQYEYLWWRAGNKATMETHSWPLSCVDPLSPWHTLLTRPVIPFCSFIWPRHCHLLASFPAPPSFLSLAVQKSGRTLSFRFFVRMRGEPGNEASHLSLTTFSTSVALAFIVWFYWYTETCIGTCINMCITQSNISQIWYIVAPDIMVFLKHCFLYTVCTI